MISPDYSPPDDRLTDAGLFALTRSTTWWEKGISDAGDFYDIRPHLLVLYTIAKWVCWPDPRWPQAGRPPVIVEIGVRQAISTVALLHACRETGGTVYAVDCDPNSQNWARQFIAKAGTADLCRLIEARSEEWDGMPEVIDFLFVDGDHQEPQVYLDLDRYAPHVRPNGIIACHDYYSDPACQNQPVSPPFSSYVSRAVAKLVAAYPGRFECLVLPWAFGLALLRVKP